MAEFQPMSYLKIRQIMRVLGRAKYEVDYIIEQLYGAHFRR